MTALAEAASVIVDLFDGVDDKDMLEAMVNNERCRREGLPARWWLYERERQAGWDAGWCNRKAFIEGSTVMTRQRLGWIARPASGDKRWREVLAEANVCRVHTDFCVVDLDTKDLSALTGALREAGQNIGALDLTERVESPRGFHFYTRKHEPMRMNGMLGCRRLKKYPIDLKWGGIMVSPGSEVDGKIYRSHLGQRWPAHLFAALMSLDGEDLERYPEERVHATRNGSEET